MQKQSEEIKNPQQKAIDSFYTDLLNRSASGPETDSSWLITLCDVLLLLVIFFMVFLVSAKNTETAADKGSNNIATVELKEKRLNQKIAPIGEIIRNQIASEIKVLDLENDVFVVATNSEVVITLKESVTFKPGRAQILDDSHPILDNIAGIIKKHPDFLVEINGHTDSIPIKTNRFPSNWELSVARATSVLKYIIKNHPVDPSRFAIKGNADQKPVASNDTPENRAQNRRVEIRLTETSPQT